MTLIPFENAEVEFGQAGIAGTGITTAEKASITSRLTALEAITPATTLSGLTDAEITSPADGQVLRYNLANTRWENYTWPSITYTFGIPFVFDGGGSAITTGVKYQGIEIPFACTITGWTATSSANAASTNFVVTVSKATYAAHSTYTAISGTEKPTIAIGANKGQDLTLTTWTTAVSAGDLLQVSVDSTGNITLGAVTLRLTRSI